MLGVPRMSIYGATKAAIQSLTTTWALELADSKVRVYGISPYARTQMFANVDERMWPKLGPEVVAPLAVYLMTERAAPLHGKLLRMADGRLSFFRPGTYGPTLGEHEEWTDDMLHAALQEGARAEQFGNFDPLTAEQAS